VAPLRERRDEIHLLTDFFLAKYSQRYNRPVRALSDELRARFLQYEWPGNVRELENMIKRFVILQDETLVVKELNKPRPQSHTTMTLAASAAPSEYTAPPPFQSPPSSGYAPDEDADEEDEVEDEPVTAPPSQEGRRLADVSREAALAAERTVIAETLKQVHWNRRKAAQLLGVSYKTLLNKIKETGIERP
jgi:two-component system response regulator AtoC